MPLPLKPAIEHEVLVALVNGDLPKIAELEKTHRFAIKNFRSSGYQLCDDSASCPNTPFTKILNDALQFEKDHNSTSTNPAIQQKLQDAVGAKNALYFAPNADITAALCRKGVDINASSAQLSPLIWQVQCYHLSNFLELLVHGANTHTKYPLFADISTLQFVLEQLNDCTQDTTLLPDALSEAQKTMFDMARALMVATNHPFEQKPHSITTIEKYLVSNIENPAIREHLLTLAAAKQRIPADLQEELTVYTPSLQAAIAEKNTPLHIFAAEGRKDLLRVAIKRGGLFVDVNAKNAAGETPLTVALKNNHVDTAEYLIREHGAVLSPPAEAYVKKFSNPQQAAFILQRLYLAQPKTQVAMANFHNAIVRSDTNAVRKSLANGMPIEVKDPHGDTGLHVAIMKEDLRMVTLLCENGADRKALSCKGKTCLELTKNPEIRSFLQALDAKEQAQLEAEHRIEQARCAQNQRNADLLQAAAAKNQERLCELIAEGAQLETKDHLGDTVWHKLAAKGAVGCLEALHAQFPLHRYNTPNSSGDTPLHQAMQGQHGHVKEVVEWLLWQGGASPLAVNKKGQTAAALAPKDIATLVTDFDKM